MSPNHGLAAIRGEVLAAEDVPDAVEELFRRDYDKFVRAAWLLSGSRDVAEDLVQDVFAVMLVSDHWRHADDLVSYVHRAVINRVRSWQRRQALERRYAKESLSGEPPVVVPPDQLHGLPLYLAALSQRQRTAIVLRYYWDLPLAEVAAVMGCRVGTVTVLIRRALHKAQKMKEVIES